MANFIIATIKPWNISEYLNQVSSLSGVWHLIDKKEDFTLEKISAINPQKIFFPHWSWIVPEKILSQYDCVCFHMTDLPYGRGGSPLQNLIVRGHTSTYLTALKMTGELDAGPVYLKSKIALDGSAQEIFTRVAARIYDLIREIVADDIEPQPQQGDVVQFERRHPQQSQLPQVNDLHKLYDHIRMLDAETYPKAYIDCGAYKVELADAKLEHGELTATAKIKLT